MDNQNNRLPSASGLTNQVGNNDLNVKSLAELESLGIKMTAMESRISEKSRMEVNQRSQASNISSASVSALAQHN